MTPQAQKAYDALKTYIEENYPMLETQTGGPDKYGKSMLRYRKNRSFCTLFEQEAGFHLLIALGAKERAAFEAQRELYAPETLRQYEEATTYHDGKWILFPIEDDSALEDYKRILALKRKPRPNQA